MKHIKNVLAVLFIAFTLQIADTTTTQAKPVSEFQSITIRAGQPHRRYYPRRVYRRPVYRRPVYHRGWHRRPPMRHYRRY